MTLDDGFKKGREHGWEWAMVYFRGVPFHVFYDYVVADPQNGVAEAKEPKLIFLGSYEMYDLLDAQIAGMIGDELQDTPRWNCVDREAL